MFIYISDGDRRRVKKPKEMDGREKEKKKTKKYPLIDLLRVSARAVRRRDLLCRFARCTYNTE